MKNIALLGIPFGLLALYGAEGHLLHLVSVFNPEYFEVSGPKVLGSYIAGIVISWIIVMVYRGINSKSKV